MAGHIKGHMVDLEASDITACQLPAQKRVYLLVDLLAQPADLALGMPVMPIALTRSSTEGVETPRT
jgi:hypothetical protein